MAAFPFPNNSSTSASWSPFSFSLPSNRNSSASTQPSYLFGSSLSSPFASSSSSLSSSSSPSFSFGPPSSASSASAPLFGFGASSTPALFGTLAASSVFGSNSHSSSSSGAASTTAATSSISSTFFGSYSSNSTTPSPAFASSPFGASSSSSASSTPSFSNLFGSSSSSSKSSSSASPFSSSASPFSVSPSPFSGSASPFSTPSAPAFSFPGTAASTAASTSLSSLSSAPASSFSTSSASSSAAPGFSFPTVSSSSSRTSSLFAASPSSTAPGSSFPSRSSSTLASSSAPGFSFPTGSSLALASSFSTSSTTSSSLFTSSSSAAPGFSFPTVSSSSSRTSSLFAASPSSTAPGSSFPSRYSSTLASSSAPGFSFPTGSSPAFSLSKGTGSSASVAVSSLTPSATLSSSSCGFSLGTSSSSGFPSSLRFGNVASATSTTTASVSSPEVAVAKPTSIGFGTASSSLFSTVTATTASTPAPSTTAVSTPAVSTVTSGITVPSFGVSSSATTSTTAPSTAATPTVSFPSFGTPSTGAPSGTTGLSFSLSSKTPTTASTSQSHSQSAALFGPAATSTAGTTISTSSATQSTSALVVASSSGTTSSIGAAVASAPKLPSEITGKTVEEIIKEWNAELQERTGKFRKQATAIAEWDRRILLNRDVLLRLETEVANVVETQTNLERQLELIETHQEGVDKALQSMEDEAERIYKDERGLLLDDEAASTRDAMYEQAEFIERELEQMTEQIKSIIQAGELEATDGMTPLDVVVRILNNQLISLMWIDEKVDDDEDDIPSVAKGRTLLGKSCTATLPISRLVDHPTATVDEVEESATRSEPIVSTVEAPLRSIIDFRGLNVRADVLEVHGSPRVEMEGKNILPAAHADHGDSGSALVDCNVALDPPFSRGNLSNPIVDFYPPPKNFANSSSIREGISVEPLGGAICDGQVGMTSKDIFHGVTDDPPASESIDLSLLGRFPQAAVQTVRIAASTTIGTSQQMPRGSTSSSRGSTSSSAPISTYLSAASAGSPRVSPLVALKAAPTRPSFDLSRPLASWRGFQVSPSSRESLERLFTQFPHLLDRFQLRTGHFQTFVLDRLASLGDEMHDMLVSDVQETDLDRLKCIIDDLSIVGIDVSFFRDRLDVVASTCRAANLRSTIAMRRREHAMYTRELLTLESAAKDLRIELEKMESAVKDLRAILTENEQARDVAIADLEALDTYFARLDPSLSLDQVGVKCY